MIKTIFFGLILGGSLGVSLAVEVFNRVGMQPQTYLLLLSGLLVAILLVNRGVAIISVAIVLTYAVLQPEQELLVYGFDKDLLMAALLGILVYPVVYRVMQS